MTDVSCHHSNTWKLSIVTYRRHRTAWRKHDGAPVVAFQTRRSPWCSRWRQSLNPTVMVRLLRMSQSLNKKQNKTKTVNQWKTRNTALIIIHSPTTSSTAAITTITTPSLSFPALLWLPWWHMVVYRTGVRTDRGREEGGGGRREERRKGALWKCQQNWEGTSEQQWNSHFTQVTGERMWTNF